MTSPAKVQRPEDERKHHSTSIETGLPCVPHSDLRIRAGLRDGLAIRRTGRRVGVRNLASVERGSLMRFGLAICWRDAVLEAGLLDGHPPDVVSAVCVEDEQDEERYGVTPDYDGQRHQLHATEIMRGRRGRTGKPAKEPEGGGSRRLRAYAARRCGRPGTASDPEVGRVFSSSATGGEAQETDEA